MFALIALPNTFADEGDPEEGGDDEGGDEEPYPVEVLDGDEAEY